MGPSERHGRDRGDGSDPICRGEGRGVVYEGNMLT